MSARLRRVEVNPNGLPSARLRAVKTGMPETADAADEGQHLGPAKDLANPKPEGLRQRDLRG